MKYYRLARWVVKLSIPIGKGEFPASYLSLLTGFVYRILERDNFLGGIKPNKLRMSGWILRNIPEKNSSLSGLVSYNDPCKTLSFLLTSFWGWRCPVISGEISCVVFGWWNHVHVFFFAENTIFIEFIFWMISKIWISLQWQKWNQVFFFLIFIPPKTINFAS